MELFGGSCLRRPRWMTVQRHLRVGERDPEPLAERPVASMGTHRTAATPGNPLTRTLILKHPDTPPGESVLVTFPNAGPPERARSLTSRLRPRSWRPVAENGHGHGGGAVLGSNQ